MPLKMNSRHQHCFVLCSSVEALTLAGAAGDHGWKKKNEKTAHKPCVLPKWGLFQISKSTKDTKRPGHRHHVHRKIFQMADAFRLEIPSSSEPYIRTCFYLFIWDYLSSLIFSLKKKTLKRKQNFSIFFQTWASSEVSICKRMEVCLLYVNEWKSVYLDLHGAYN